MSNSPKKVASYSAVVGSIIANYRKSRSLGQTEISSKSSISQATWSRIERGATAINVSQLSEISSLLNISPSQILNDADKMINELKTKGVEISHYPQKDKETMLILGASALIGLAALFMSE